MCCDLSRSAPTPRDIGQGIDPPRESGTLPARPGLGLKPQHFDEILQRKPDIGFFEIHAENYFVAGGPFHRFLSQIRELYALSIHGVGLSIGGAAPPDQAHLRALRTLLRRYEPESFSEHLAWSSHGGVFLNDLLPLPYTNDTLTRICAHIDQVQTYLGRQMLLENPATYVEFQQSSYCEAEFITEVVARSGCGLLLDVNNAYISCTNHGRCAEQYIAALPLHAVAEMHLAGFSRDSDSAGAPLLIDSHGSRVDPAVWELYGNTIERIGPSATLIEWDNHLPPLSTLLAEAELVQNCLTEARGTNDG
ncbi:MNIO family bufferin maturase [Microbulbifer hainanensis]|uniref:MNIO family bufferin maturase n=1 Tax=Microbulbifer hainanensis TaxID=2735675 RepID=UPI0018695096|nr:DUF692 domain-containing protein [Microbulbifer hainanensis]